ncbi:flagellar hook-length control protein FliK [Vibrio sp. Of7-15]|uniref:flagellar hook-length control protein FliK n=1 Tax=Vibrio sp. Of7-15 TaxID=2724879 RepID=UPI001EF1645D|nr:flagellar hook-length control protein FliK [Vibrio sp. Of7-15]MCG7499149.1 flagellar hook-length control protein FliK [Vibrio sp. Of7-15]
MNLQNLSVSDAAVKTTVTPSASSAADSVQIDEGSFLQELKDLIWDSEQPSESESTKVQEQQLKSVDVSEKEGKAPETVESKEPEAAEIKKAEQNKEETLAETEKATLDDNEVELASSDAERSAAMAEGNEVLNRLNEANNTLTKGNSLPQSVKVEKAEANSTVMTSVTPESSQPSELAETGSALGVSSTVSVAGKSVSPVETTRVSTDGTPLSAVKQTALGSTEPLSQEISVEGETPLTVASLGGIAAKELDVPASLQRHMSGSANSPASASVTPENLPSQELSAKDLQSVSLPQAHKLGAQAIPSAALEKGQIDIAALGMTAVDKKEVLDSSGKPLPDGLNQQLSALAGLQGTQALQQTRTEQQVQAQMVQQAPLQLTREQATEKLSERINLMLSKNLKHVDIRLDPPELGRMQIRLSMNNDQASVQFTVANGQARDVVDQAMPRLREMMLQQGIQLADTSVQQQSSGQSQQGYAEKNDHGDDQYAAESHLDDEQQATELSLEVEQPKQGISFYA